MKKVTLLSLLILLSATLFTYTSAFGAGGNALKYNENYKQKVLCSSYYGYCDVFDYGKFKVTVKLSLEGKDIDLSQIDGNTSFYFEVGNVYVNALLGNGQYIQGRKSSKANFVFSDYDWVTDNEKAQYMWVTLKWNAKKLTIKIKGLTGTPDITYPIIAYDYLYEDSGIYTENLFGYVSFAGAEWAFDVPSSIKVKQGTKKDKYKYPWDVWKIKAKGKGYEVPVE